MGSTTPEPDPCPLDCPVCSKEFTHPIRLSCQHCFCHDCITEKKCPTCSKPIESLEFKEDTVLSYLIESSREHTETCANCDQALQPMYYCKTCKEPLCVNCKSSTHQARIFANHNIVDLEECGRDRGKTNCLEHNETFILFCLDQRKLMCAKCFNGSSVENRHNFVNIDKAHKLCWSKLEDKVKNLKSFHEELREHIEIRRRTLAELGANYGTVASDVEKKAGELVAKILEIKKQLLEKLENEKQQRADELQVQLTAMTNLVNPIKLNLLSASVICSAASEIDLLHCYGDLVKGIKGILENNLERITSSSEVITDYQDEFMKLMEKSFGWNAGLLTHRQTPPPIVPKLTNQTVATISPVVHSRSAFDLVKSRSTSPLSSYANYVTSWKTNSNSSNDGLYYQNLATRTAQNQSDLTGTFGEYFKKIDSPLSEMSIELTRLSRDLIELQRDITLRRCVVRKDVMDKLIERTQYLEKTVKIHIVFMEDIQPVLGSDWQELMDRIRRQQKLFKDKMRDVQYIQEYALRAKQTAITLKPFAVYMASVIGITDSRRSDMIELAPMEKICLEICNLEPDSQKRIEAIEKEEEAQRVAREVARAEEQQAVIKAKQSLKATKEHVRKSSFSSNVVTENNRDRNSMGTPVTRSSKRRQKLNLENICCDDSGSMMSGHSTSPRELLTSPTTTSEGSVRSSLAPSPVDELLEPFSPTKSMVDLPSTATTDFKNMVDFTSINLPKKPGTPLLSPISVLVSPMKPQVSTPESLTTMAVVPISIVPPCPPPPPLGFVAPVRTPSVDEHLSPQAVKRTSKVLSSASVDSPTYETVCAREQLLVQIKERFRKSSEGQES